jgi:hypothetical protein
VAHYQEKADGYQALAVAYEKDFHKWTVVRRANPDFDYTCTLAVEVFFLSIPVVFSLALRGPFGTRQLDELPVSVRATAPVWLIWSVAVAASGLAGLLALATAGAVLPSSIRLSLGLAGLAMLFIFRSGVLIVLVTDAWTIFCG